MYGCTVQLSRALFRLAQRRASLPALEPNFPLEIRTHTHTHTQSQAIQKPEWMECIPTGFASHPEWSSLCRLHCLELVVAALTGPFPIQAEGF